MEGFQDKFILEQLNMFPICEIKEKYINNLKEVSTTVIRKILNQKFVNGSDMRAVLCLFDTLFLSTINTTNVRENGLYNLTDHINKLIKRMKKIPVKSSEGFVYITNILSKDIQVIIKVPRTDYGFNQMVREYFIGIKAINKLRYLIPNFVYTLGSFLCPKPTNSGKICTEKTQKTAFVLYEKIPGKSLDILLQNNELIFEEWLIIFFQILLSLEVAQREIRFTHFDLHAGNVIIRKKDKFSYVVPLDNITYHINNPENFPVMIDFGISSAYIDNRYIGTFNYAKYGILNFMIPGYDMYKFMIYSVIYTKCTKMRTKIMSLFQFYDKDDPYNVFDDFLQGKNDSIKVAANEYCKEVTFSRIATYTPNMMLKWLWKEFRKELSSKVRISERIQYLPLQYSNTIKEYEDIFNHSNEGREYAIKLVDNCINLRASYVMTKYNKKILENYNEYLQSPYLSYRIKSLNIYLKESEGLIDVDKAMLEKVFNIEVPDQTKLTNTVNNLLEITIRHSNPDNKRNAVSELDIIVYQEKLNPYLQFYFTIFELNLEDKFSDWIYRFRNSELYLFYLKNVNSNERAIRWGQTLLASII